MHSKSIYNPREDTYLIARHIKKYAKGSVLDMGAGSGILAKEAKKYAKKVLAVDVNKEAVAHVNTLGIKTIHSDLFESVPKQVFDVILCNPPYLPEEPLEPTDSALTTTGGKKGSELIERFLKQAKEYLTKDGTILLIFSSLSGDIEGMAKEQGYTFKVIDQISFDFENIFCAEIKKKK